MALASPSETCTTSTSCTSFHQNSGSGFGSGSGSGSGSEGDVQQQHMHMHMHIITEQEQRKRKRMQSNRESARKSRMRKQQHLDGLIAQAGQLKKENSQIVSSMGITTQLCIKLEEENAILSAQVAELSNRLQSLDEIIHYININSGNYLFDNHCGFLNPCNSLSPSENQPIMASAHMLMY